MLETKGMTTTLAKSQCREMINNLGSCLASCGYLQPVVYHGMRKSLYYGQNQYAYNAENQQKHIEHVIV